LFFFHVFSFFLILIERGKVNMGGKINERERQRTSEKKKGGEKIAKKGQ
jgi:hypothetical protein